MNRAGWRMSFKDCREPAEVLGGPGRQLWADHLSGGNSSGFVFTPVETVDIRVFPQINVRMRPWTATGRPPDGDLVVHGSPFLVHIPSPDAPGGVHCLSTPGPAGVNLCNTRWKPRLTWDGTIVTRFA